MPDVQRHFLGWDKSTPHAVADFLLETHNETPPDFESDLIIVPTRQAGRRLREALAVRDEQTGGAVLSLRIVTPPVLLHPETPDTREATRSDVIAAWCRVLEHVDGARVAALFPTAPPATDPAWQVQTAQALEEVRLSLAEAGLGIADVLADLGSTLPEPERWRCLAELETAVRKRLRATGLTDPCSNRTAFAADPSCPAGVSRIILASVPDPPPLVLQALDVLTRRVEVHVLVLAPPGLEETFDTWGRPLTGPWSRRPIAIPDADRNIVLAATPRAQAEHVLHELSALPDGLGPADVAVGTPDSTVTPDVETVLEADGIRAFDPADKPVAEHPLAGLIQGYCNLVTMPSASNLSTFLRHPDLLQFLQRRHDLPTDRVLAQLDDVRAHLLPLDIATLTAHAASDSFREHSPELAETLDIVAELVERHRVDPFPSSLRTFLQRVYSGRSLHSGRPKDDVFTAASDLVDTALREAEGLAVNTVDAALTIFAARLAVERLAPQHGEADVDLEGWLELPWTDASILLVTGMNDGVVPDTRIADPFLPDSLREQLGLRHDLMRLARDSFLLQQMLASRQEHGRVVLIAGKTGAAGDPLRPSRLLFRCTDTQLPERARLLFGDAVDLHPHLPATVGFRLDARPPRDVSPDALRPSRLAVTAFRDYLACPFRFYLKRILRMDPVEPRKNEMDALDFGILVHAALQAMAETPEMAACQDEDALRTFLVDRARSWTRRRFGPAPSLAVRIALESAAQRLGAAAREQVTLVREGWEILHAEQALSVEIQSCAVHGKIDRIDRHRDTGHLRIIDYKTSDAPSSPPDAHLGPPPEAPDGYNAVRVGGKPKRWKDLQLPLYAMLARDNGLAEGEVGVAYFNLPKATAETGIRDWSAFTDEIAQKAAQCAETIVSRIGKAVYWPPQERVTYDDFEALFRAGTEASVDGDTFCKFLEEVRR